MKLIDKIYLKFFVSSGFSYAEYLRERGFFNSQGKGCYIAKSANIPDPYLTSIGDNVWITSGCQLLCHDASVIMINLMCNKNYDRVGPIIIGSNCFMGNNVIILSDTTVGSNTVIGAGSVVTKNISSNAVYAGNPAKMICSMEEYIKKVENTTKQYPWSEMLSNRNNKVFDPTLENILKKERKRFFLKGD